MADKPKILLIGNGHESGGDVSSVLQDRYELVPVENPYLALSLLADRKREYDGVFVPSGFLGDAFELGVRLQSERILEGMPDGVALLDGENNIIWGIQRAAPRLVG